MKFKELAWAVGEKPTLGFCSTGSLVTPDDVFLYASGSGGHMAMWGVNTSERRHFYIRGEYRQRPTTFNAYGAGHLTLSDPKVSLAEIEKQRIDAGEVDVLETPERVDEVKMTRGGTGSWIGDAWLAERICAYSPWRKGDGWSRWIQLRDDPKSGIAYILTSAAANHRPLTPVESEEVEWMKRYLEAQKVPFKIEEHKIKGAPHLDSVTVA